MTDVLFVTISAQPSLHQEINGSLLLATKLLRDGFEVKVLRFGEIESFEKDYPKFIGDITARILEIAPKCVSFYSLCNFYHIVLGIARELKSQSPKTYTVLGGPQATLTAFDTLKAMDFIDFVCTGEGENTVVPFFRALLRENGKGLGDIPGLFYRQDGGIVFSKCQVPQTDVNTLPYWDDSLLLPSMGVGESDISSDTYFMPIDTGRGCPYNCTFCSTSFVWNRKYRLKSAKRIIEDFQYFNRKFGIRSFDVAHDAFTVNEKLVTELCDYIKESGLDIKWKCSTRIDCISKELILKMKEAGLSHISRGVESGSRRMQESLKKRLDLTTIKPMVQFLQENGIEVTLLFMYGFPDETEEELNETLELCFSIMDVGRYHLCMFYCLFDPCTELTASVYDRLVFDPTVQSITDGVFGFTEESDMIEGNKSIFPFFHHLNTPVRDNYQCLHYLSRLYESVSDVLYQVRKRYDGDNLWFYRDFYEANRSILYDFNVANQVMAEDPLQMIVNLLNHIHFPNLVQVQAIMQFKKDMLIVLRSKEDISIQRCYDFNYKEYRENRPLEELSVASSELLLKKENGQSFVRLLQIITHPST